MLPPKGSFHGDGQGILAIFYGLSMYESVLILEYKPTKLLLKAQEIRLIPKYGKSA